MHIPFPLPHNHNHISSSIPLQLPLQEALGVNIPRNPRPASSTGGSGAPAPGGSAAPAPGGSAAPGMPNIGINDPQWNAAYQQSLQVGRAGGEGGRGVGGGGASKAGRGVLQTQIQITGLGRHQGPMRLE
jgi:hypothetical protein